MSKVQELYEILERDRGVYSVTELMTELKMSEKNVRGLVKYCRKLCNEGKEYKWIHATGRGYTLYPNPSDVMKESSHRFKTCVGVYLNGLPVFGKAKRIAPSQFNNLKISYKPAVLKIGKMF